VLLTAKAIQSALTLQKFFLLKVSLVCTATNNSLHTQLNVVQLTVR